MKETIKQFISTYLNSQNAFMVTVSVMLLLLILYVILSCVGFASIKKIIKALRNESGEGIIKKIESLRLSRRFEKMWDDYYEAYCSEDTVALNNYLVKKDMLIQKNMFRLVSRVVAVAGFSAAVIGAIKIPGILEAEKPNLICMFFALLSVQAVFEIFYAFFENLRKKRIARFLEEFEILCKRKLSGKAASFENKHVINKMDGLEEQVNLVRSGVNQINARLDRQYRFLENMEKPEE